ncbi:GNAT family N-acetyltransferase [Micrococcales bacterium 31B]|nr:GNAT family N-acetyltransferase [Micrococcales bacterium 31B]
MTIVRLQCREVRQPPVVLGGARRAQDSDWPALEALFTEYKHEIEHQDGLVPDAAALREHLEARLRGVARGEYWVWEVSGLVVAVAGLWTGEGVPPGEAELGALTTNPEHRRKGYARNLATALCQAALREGHVPVIQIERDVGSASRLCAALGFREAAAE